MRFDDTNPAKEKIDFEEVYRKCILLIFNEKKCYELMFFIIIFKGYIRRH